MARQGHPFHSHVCVGAWARQTNKIGVARSSGFKDISAIVCWGLSIRICHVHNLRSKHDAKTQGLGAMGMYRISPRIPASEVSLEEPAAHRTNPYQLLGSLFKNWLLWLRAGKIESTQCQSHVESETEKWEWGACPLRWKPNRATYLGARLPYFHRYFCISINMLA